MRTNTLAISEELSRALPPGWISTTEDSVDFLFSVRVGAEAQGRRRRNFHLLYSDDVLAERTLDLGVLFETLEHLLLTTVSIYSKSLVFVHAGVVGWDGGGVLVPGRSGTGKTTLVETLVKAGGTYYSDEMAVLDSEGYVHPLARDLSLRKGDFVHRVSPISLAASVGDRPIPVRLILSTSYRFAATWRPRPLTPSRALMTLFNNAVAARQDPERILSVIEKTVAGASALKGRRGEADQILKFLSAGRAPCHISAVPRPSSSSNAPMTASRRIAFPRAGTHSP